MVALFIGFRGPPQGSQEPSERGLGIGEWGAGHLNSRADYRLGSGDPHASDPQGVSREWKGKLLSKKVNSLPKVQQKWPHLPGRRASSCGESLAGRNIGPSSWQPPGTQQVLAQSPDWDVGWEQASRGFQGQ